MKSFVILIWFNEFEFELEKNIWKKIHINDNEFN